MLHADYGRAYPAVEYRYLGVSFHSPSLHISTLLTPPSVVIATGILSLVDDCIKRRFHTKQSTQLHIPLLRNKLHLDYVGPKRLIDEMFNRTGRGAQTGRQTSALRRPATQA